MYDQNKITTRDVENSPICEWKYGIRVYLLRETDDCLIVHAGDKYRTTVFKKKEVLFLN